MLQIFFDAVGRGKNPFSGGGFNIVKFMLSVIAIFFDLIFLTQHYVLYRHAWVADREKRRMEKQGMPKGDPDDPVSSKEYNNV